MRLFTVTPSFSYIYTFYNSYYRTTLTKQNKEGKNEH